MQNPIRKYNHPENIPEDQIIAQDVDANGRALKIWFSRQLSGSRCLPLFLKIYAEAVEEDHGGGFITWDDSKKHRAVYCTDLEENKVLGGIAFIYNPPRREGWIILSFTDPAERGCRINQVMHKYFENIIWHMGGTNIASHVSINNQARLKSAERSGFEPAFYRMSKKLSPPEET